MPTSLTRFALALVIIIAGAAGLGAACNGRRTPAISPEPGSRSAAATAALRLYYLIDLDGYLEPCGCQQRPLGGIDRLAKFLERERATAPRSLFVAAGDLLYRDPTLDARMVYQEDRKAESMVQILDQLHLRAYAPGPADFVRGRATWQRLASAGHAVPLIANAAPALPAPARSSVVQDVSGLRVGIVGVSDFRESLDATPPSGAPSTSDPVAGARAGVAAVRAQGAQLVVVLASVARRDALGIARSVPGVHFVIAAREESPTPPPPQRVGTTFVVTAANQGKSVGVIDVFLRDGAVTALEDHSETTLAAQRALLDGRITELRTRLSEWDRDPTADRAAVAQQRTRLATLERDRAALGAARATPGGSYFRARVQEIAPELPKRNDVEQAIANYFRAVNEHNRVEYAGLRTPAPARGQAGYVGDETCRDCHAEAYDIWLRTPHSRAYHTLEAVAKNFNLSCVGCHVTGYQRPGGAEVVQNEGRRDVQCESCHGPGSLHVAARSGAQRRATIQRDVPAGFCASQCHTPEHSDHFDYATYLPRILGPGHGFPEGSDGGGVSLASPVLAGGASPPHTDLSTSDGGRPTAH